MVGQTPFILKKADSAGTECWPQHVLSLNSCLVCLRAAVKKHPYWWVHSNRSNKMINLLLSLWHITSIFISFNWKIGYITISFLWRKQINRVCNLSKVPFKKKNPMHVTNTLQEACCLWYCTSGFHHSALIVEPCRAGGEADNIHYHTLPGLKAQGHEHFHSSGIPGDMDNP